MISLRQQFELAKAQQDLETLVVVVNKVFGGGGETKNAAKPVETMDELQMMFSKLGGTIGGGP